MSVCEDKFSFAPSLYHQRLMRGMRPVHSYAGEHFGDWQAALRAEVAGLLGQDPGSGARVPLNVRSLWRRDHEYGTIEKLVFTSEPDVDVPAYLCLPSAGKAPYPCCICLQGHTTGMHNSIGVDRDDETKAVTGEGDRDFGIGCMQHGFAALCIEQRSFGERQETRQPQHLDYLCHQAAMNALLLGRTLLGERVFDVDRAVDYLAARGDMDMMRVGVLGNSGGGTTGLFSAALLPRIRFAVPSCCFSTFQASLQSVFHCVCNYVPRLAAVADMGDIAGLVAPRPLILVSGSRDGIFPIGPARDEFARVQAMYRAAGAADRCRHVMGDGGHRFYAQDAWPVILSLVS